MDINIRPLGSRIVVVKEEPAEKKVGSFTILNIEDKLEQYSGRVVAVGPGKLLSNGIREVLEVKVGDRVVFNKYAMNRINVGEEKEEYHIMLAAEAIAVIEE